VPDMDIITPIAITSFGYLPDGREVHDYILSNKNGISVSILNYGGIIKSINTPDRYGKFDDILLGYNNLDGYLKDKTYMGAVIGRYSNRIASATINIDGINYPISRNDGSNNLHGGINGFNKVLWNTEIIEDRECSGLKLHHISHDGDQGFPGELYVTAIYKLNDDNELSIDLAATTNQKTVVSLTVHPYINLGDHRHDNINNHHLMIRSNKYLPLGENMIPTGEMRQVEYTPFDFRKMRSIGSMLNNSNEQLNTASGYDHCFVIDNSSIDDDIIAHLHHPDSGRSFTLQSNAPGLQLYTSNYLDDSISGKDEIRFRKMQAVCLEPQQFPNAPNETSFPSTVITPDEVYQHRIVFKFNQDE